MAITPTKTDPKLQQEADAAVKQGYVKTAQEYIDSVGRGMATAAAMKTNQVTQPTKVDATNIGNQNPLTLPNKPTTSPATTALGAAVASANAPVAFPEVQMTPADSRKQIIDQITGLVKEQGTKGAVTDRINEEEGVYDKKIALTNIENKIAAKERFYEKEARRIRQNKEGMFGGGMEIALNNLDRARSEELADLAIVKNAALGDYDTAREIAAAKVDAQFEPIKQQIEGLKTIYQLNQDDLSEKEKVIMQAEINKQEAELQFERQKELARYNSILNREEAAYKASLDGGSGFGSGVVADVVANNPALATLPADQQNKAVITSLLGNKSISAGTKTQVGNVLGVINAAQDLANQRLDGKFKGVSPFNRVLDVKIPWTNIGLPFRETLKSDDAVRNRQYLEAINLNVQTWASGASLTKQQIEQVEKLTPRPTDTDAKVRTKLNGLVDFMMTQTASKLQAEGINFVPEKVNLFETMELLDEASPEQLQALRDQGLIQ